MSYLRIFLVAILGCLPATLGYAEDEVYGTAVLGYSSAQSSGFTTMTGSQFQGEVAWQATKLASGPRVLLGGEALWSTVKGSNRGTDLEVRALGLGPNAAFRFALADKIDLQYQYSFNFALLGDTVIDGKAKEVKSYFRHNNNVRLLIPLYPDVDLGFGVNFFQTNVKRPDSENISVNGVTFQAVFTQKIM